MAAASCSATFSELGDTQMEPQEGQAPPLQQHQNSPAAPAAAGGATPKKKRNQPGNPNPGAEVIALSPHTLMATNRFVCEVCNKGFQREQNLQLHRRGHNLPWKLKQKNPKEVRRKVYVCPEPTCVHHDPARALGDLTGIKKHYCRKHGDKKWNCDRCNKRYAVRSDWKAHSKTCGTRDYRCECGTLFSSFAGLGFLRTTGHPSMGEREEGDRYMRERGSIQQERGSELLPRELPLSGWDWRYARSTVADMVI